MTFKEKINKFNDWFMEWMVLFMGPFVAVLLLGLAAALIWFWAKDPPPTLTLRRDLWECTETTRVRHGKVVTDECVVYERRHLP